ncbi:M4 family metallopeptidase, partial [Mariniphaga sp.]|uniref:M4 family metallopeptidase n=1 Tax=Mariniphaga sp. TaxID=1954475 RepID=UPI00356B3F6E
MKPAPATNFVLQPQKQRNKNFRHEHYDQFYNGVKVDGAGYNFHFEKGRMYLAHGNFIKIEGLSTTPSITREEAKQAFSDYKEIPVEKVAGFKADLLIKEILNIFGKDTVYSPVLVYQVYLITGHPNNDEIGYIDAQNGKVLFTEPSITGYSATGTFETRYNGTRQATAQHYNNTYNLCDSSRNAVIHTWDLNGSANINSRVELTDADNNWTANEYAASEDDMGLDIHWALQEIYDYLLNEHSISSYDDNDFDIDAYFHYGSTDNDRDNAFWNLNLNVLLFGDGAVKFNPVASLDAVAHEYGHGITDFQIGWAYSGDFQIFHEGLSDIWGIILENRISPSLVWEIGEGVILNYDCIRNIQNPEDTNAETEISDTYLSSTYNAGNQYVKSGVFSHWFYLLVNGGSGTNDNGNSYTVYGIGMDAAEDLIVEAVFNNYLDNQSTYPGIRTQTINAAASGALFGSNSFHTRQVEAAWYAVGVGTNPTQPTISGPSAVCYSGSTFTANNP